MTYRPLLKTYRNTDAHWVGDGFLTLGMLPPPQEGCETNPFLVSGYNPPHDYPPADRPRGVGRHPHRGFETVTVVYQGGLAHADSAGNTGTLGAGDVQWMTAGSGIQHQEFHSDEINRNGGTLEMVQLWVNLPQKDRNVAPQYQDIRDAEIPVDALPGGGRVRVIAGRHGAVTGPARTHSPIALWDGYLPAGAVHEMDLPEGWTVTVQLLSGVLTLEDGSQIHGPESAIFSTAPGRVRLRAPETAAGDEAGEAHYLVLAAQQLREPLVMGGPFVAGSEAELKQAYADFRKGVF